MSVICPIHKITLLIFLNTYTQIHIILFAYITTLKLFISQSKRQHNTSRQKMLPDPLEVKQNLLRVWLDKFSKVWNWVFFLLASRDNRRMKDYHLSSNTTISIGRRSQGKLLTNSVFWRPLYILYNEICYSLKMQFSLGWNTPVKESTFMWLEENHLTGSSARELGVTAYVLP